MTEAQRQALERERFFSRNFYALDTETNGFSYYEPIEIAALRFEDERGFWAPRFSCTGLP